MSNVESNHYTNKFYKSHEQGSYNSAKKVLKIVDQLFQPKSVIDVGCGIGLWLKAWQELGVNDIKGVEGDYINKSDVAVDLKYIDFHDLKKQYKVNRKYDVATTFEVGEHLPETVADEFVKTLTSLSDIVVFSAALDGQEGTYHINEQMPEYWAEKFMKKGFVPVDIIRNKIWNESDVMMWYKQNIIVYVKQEILTSLPQEVQDVARNTDPKCLTRIHPEHYYEVLSRRGLGKFIHYNLYRLKKKFKGE
jgi:2-polyprenyl-3-methyl-5-hydroxy-6-metoxy-1,4-benzoquinol methylase